jgi:hypothetical protein
MSKMLKTIGFLNEVICAQRLVQPSEKLSVGHLITSDVHQKTSEKLG